MQDDQPKLSRICILSKMFPPGVGGAETYAYELAEGLGRRGYDVDVYTQWVDRPDETADTHENVSVYRICKARKKLVTFETLRFSLTARRMVEFNEYNIVHGTLMPASTIAVTPLNGVEAPVVLTSHGTSLDELSAVTPEIPTDYLLKYAFHPMNVGMDYLAGRSADDIIAISDHARDRLVGEYGFDEDQVHLIPHGVDTDRFHPHDEVHPAVDPDKLSLLYVGRLAPRKGVALALRAFAAAEHSGMELLVGGTGRHEERLRRLASDLGVADQVRFLGYVPGDELPLLYSSADVFVLPSQYEGFGLVLLEAVACGTPVIAANVGGVPTAVDGDYGIVVDRTVDAFADAIKTVDDDGVRERMRRAAVDARDRIDWDEIIGQIVDVYEARLSVSS